MEKFENKLNLIKERIKDIKKPLILELGVKEGRSTKMFLEICDKNNGNLISVDVDNYANLFNNKNWTLSTTTKGSTTCYRYNCFDVYSKRPPPEHGG